MENTEHDDLIAKAFNAGILMQRHEPELLTKILKTTTKDSDYIKALELGKQQVQRQKIKDQQQRTKELQQEKKHKR